jgi:hypothetical protein
MWVYKFLVSESNFTNQYKLWRSLFRIWIVNDIVYRKLIGLIKLVCEIQTLTKRAHSSWILMLNLHSLIKYSNKVLDRRSIWNKSFWLVKSSNEYNFFSSPFLSTLKIFAITSFLLFYHVLVIYVSKILNSKLL